MKKKEFNQMALSKKSNMVWEWGYYLANSREGNINTIIFLVGDLIVEMFMNIEANKTEDIRAVEIEELHPDFVILINHNKPLIGKRLFAGIKEEAETAS